jgi:transposase
VSGLECERARELNCAQELDYHKIHDLHAVRPNAVTEEALRRIGALYRIEEQIRGKPPDERRRLCQAQAAPLLDDMKCWFEATVATLSAKSDTTKAIRYTLNRRSALAYYCTDEHAEIDNLIAERALRGVALGRRNFLFVGSIPVANARRQCTASLDRRD